LREILNNAVQEIKPSGIRKFFDIVSEMKDAISLGVGEPDFQTPWHIREEGIYSLERGKTHYTSNTGLKELKENVSEYPTNIFPPFVPQGSISFCRRRFRRINTPCPDNKR